MNYTHKSTTTKAGEITEEWFQIDAAGKRLGTVASKAAELLLGKHNPKTRAYLVPRTKVVIVNAEKLDITARKREGKIYTRYSGFPGGLTVKTLAEVMEKYPERVLEKAIKGMLPKNSRGREIFTSNLYVYVGTEHKHGAQKPKEINLDGFKV